VTFLASHDGVPSDQGKPRNVMIEGRRTTPTRLSVTLLATIAELAFMLVILPVARHTSCFQLVVINISGMAEIALDLRMRGSQRIFRLVVVEMIRFPLDFIMATFTLGAVTSGVNVLNLVAIDAASSDTLVSLADMARWARNGLVCTLERKLRGIVVERLDLTPSGFAVAVVAFFSKAPLMWIFRFMTIDTASGRLAEYDRG
jgi:hypothetical protein